MERIEPSAVVVDDDALERAAEAEPHRAELVDLLLIGDGARGCDLLLIDRRRHLKILILNADELVRVHRGKAHAEPVVGHDHDEALLLVVVDAVDLIDDDLLARSALPLEPRLTDEAEKGERSAVRNRRLLRVKLHITVVDALRVQRAHEMLDGKDAAAVFLDGRRAQRRRDMIRRRTDRRPPRNIRADEDDARPHRRGRETHVHIAPRVQADPRVAHGSCQSCLLLQKNTSSRGLPPRRNFRSLIAFLSYYEKRRVVNQAANDFASARRCGRRAQGAPSTRKSFAQRYAAQSCMYKRPLRGHCVPVLAVKNGPVPAQGTDPSVCERCHLNRSSPYG